MVAAFVMVVLPPDCNRTLPLEAAAVAVRIPPPQARFREANREIVTAFRLTAVVVPTVKSPRDDARRISLVIAPPFNVICAVPVLAAAVCWIVIVPRSASIAAPLSTMLPPAPEIVICPAGPGAAAFKSDN